ncbi:hypothetical protein QFZ34_002113 [Phyllobacterium ifriqiyense]|uniref:Uncharacterized protein n=1 Tax=Phyllobacterium ifriqiyense TaxID=314238 RepID=A0ABU0S856_9HYPH|nr:hypothetical protein [Phyllobacterium ifriqiyense]
MTDFEKWLRDGELCGWTMPRATLWKRLPVIRQLRSAWAQYQIERWYAYGPGSIGLRTGYDEWVAYGIWHGKERP